MAWLYRSCIRKRDKSKFVHSQVSFRTKYSSENEQVVGDATSRIRTLERNETLWRIHSEV